MTKVKDNEIKDVTIASNLFWRFADRVGSQGISSIISVLVARILDPSAFAVVAIINTFISIFSFFSDFGLGDSLIQKKDADDLDFSSVFYVNIGFCLLIYLTIFLLAPYIAKFYNDDLICPLIRVSAISIVISSIKNIQHAYVARNLMFKKFFFASLTGTILSGIIGVVVALLGYGPWALVVSSLVDLIVDTIFTWFTVKWRPKPLFSFHRVKELFSFSSRLLVSRFFNQVDSKLSQLIIGKFYPQENLAFFNKGNTLPDKISNSIDYSINSVLFPVLSLKQDNNAEVKKISKQILRNNFYIISPLLIGLFLVAEPAIIVIYTEKWLGAVPYIRIFCLIYLMLPIQTVNINIVKSLGRSDIFLKQEIIKEVLSLSAIILMIKKSTILFALSYLFVSFICMFINSYPNKKLVSYGLLEQIKDIADIITIDVIMGVAVWAIGLFNLPMLYKFILQVATGGTIFFLFSYTTKNDVFINAVNTMKGKIKK